MTAYIGFDNKIELSIDSTGTTETVGKPLSNAINWNLYDTWEPGVSGTGYAYFELSSSVTIDYFALYGHNMSDGTLIYCENWNGSAWVLAHSHTVSGENAIFERFTESTASRWRLRFTGLSVSTYITTVSAGKAMRLNPLRAPFSPPPKAKNVQIINNESVENIPLGRITRPAPFPIRIDQTIVAEAWIEANTQNLINHINAKPFFFSWDDTKDDACICWTDEPVKPPAYRNYGYQDFSIRAWGFR